jgi:hypothetical protein
MTVVLPISHVDAKIAGKLCAWIGEIDRGSYPDHTVVVFVTKLAEQVFDDIAPDLREAFGIVEKVVQPSEDERGWPHSSNTLFRDVAYYIGTHPKYVEKPYYFFEADNTPTRSGWLHDLDAEYLKGGKPYMGYLQPTLYKNNDTGELVEDYPHMVGTGVYPGDFCYRSNLIRFPYTTPFDIHHYGEIVSDLHPINDLIQHNWGTLQYKNVKGRIYCSARDYPEHFAKYIKSTALVVHGCKDGSLIDVLREKARKIEKRKALELQPT